MEYPIAGKETVKPGDFYIGDFVVRIADVDKKAFYYERHGCRIDVKFDESECAFPHAGVFLRKDEHGKLEVSAITLECLERIKRIEEGR